MVEKHGNGNRKLRGHTLNHKHKAERGTRKLCFGKCISSSLAAPPKPPQTEPITQYQVFKYLSLWEMFLIQTIIKG